MLPFMKSKNATSVYTINAFGGLNPSYSQKLNELSETLNTASELYPALTTYKAPEELRRLSHRALCAGYFNNLYTLEKSDDNRLYISTENSTLDISGFSSEITGSDDNEYVIEKNRTMEFMKDELLIIPDNVIYHTNTNTAEAGCVSEKFTPTTAQNRFEKQSGTTSKMPMPYNTWYSATLSGNAITSMSGNYRVSSTTYRYYHMGIQEDFNAGDVVTIKMAVKPIDVEHDDAYRAYIRKMSNGISVKIKELVKTSHSTPSGSLTEYTEIKFEDNAIDLGGYSEVLVIDISIEKGIPNFVDICSFENRMWGVTENKIHASRLGDASEWNDFSVDSYGTLPASCFATEVETDGNFTAICAYNGNILAFKEDCIHKIYGSVPDEFTVTKIQCPGVKNGCKDTIATIGGTLYYMGLDGVYAYSGSMPRLISKNILTDLCHASFAGSDNRYYYIDVHSDDIHHIYVYDTLCSIWHKTVSREDIVAFASAPDEMYMITENSVLRMNSLPPESWNFEFEFWSKEYSSKHVCGICMRYSLEKEGNLRLTLINRHKSYTLAETAQETQNGVMQLRLPVSCDRDARLIFEGSGTFVLNSLEIRYKETSND